MEGEYMSRTCKLASLFLALAMLLSFGCAFAQEAEVETEAPAVSAPAEETAAPAEQPATEEMCIRDRYPRERQAHICPQR